MKQHRRRALLVLLLLTAGVTFIATYAWQSDPAQAPQPMATRPAAGRLGTWLGLDPAVRDTVTQLELAYRAERRELETAVAAERDTLAALFDDGHAGDDEILEQVDRIVAANDALERRTARFLLDVRRHLSTEQQQRLLRHFAEGVREGGRYRWRGGWTRQEDEVEDAGAARPGRERGRGGPPWSGRQRP